MVEVIEVVKRVSSRDLVVPPSPRRAVDPAQIVAESELIRERLGWRPRRDDLKAIVGRALA